MWIKFLKPKQGLGYFAGDEVEMPDEDAKTLIEEGFAMNVDQPAEESDLPVDLKGREILIKAGLVTIEQVLAAKETLTDINGIGAVTAASILETLSTTDK